MQKRLQPEPGCIISRPSQKEGQNFLFCLEPASAMADDAQRPVAGIVSQQALDSHSQRKMYCTCKGMLARRFMHLAVFPVDILAVMSSTQRKSLPFVHRVCFIWFRTQTWPIPQMQCLQPVESAGTNNSKIAWWPRGILLGARVDNQASSMQAFPGTRDAPHPHGR